MNDVKGIFSSKTVWGALIAGLAAIAGPIFHVNVTDVDVQQIVDAVSKVLEVGGSLFAIYGRIVATKAIG